MYAPLELPAVYFSVLASSAIVVATVSGFLPTLGISALDLSFHIPELLSDTLLFRRFLLGLLIALNLTLPCGKITVVLLLQEL